MKKEIQMKKISTLILILAMPLVNGCETQLNEPATGALLGGGAGAGLGAIIGNQTGHAGAGTAIGAGAGALLGAVVGEANRRNKEQTKEEIRQELAQRGYYQPMVPAAAPYYAASPVPAQPVQQQPQAQMKVVHTKFNPKTGETFPEEYKYDPKTGDELQYIR
jgi:predicted lipid-binding transport protein (Tim44 family)